MFVAAKSRPSFMSDRRTARLGICLGLLTALSFAFSIHQTAANSGVAYFDTRARFWELSVGGVVLILEAFVRPPPNP